MSVKWSDEQIEFQYLIQCFAEFHAVTKWYKNRIKLEKGGNKYRINFLR